MARLTSVCVLLVTSALFAVSLATPVVRQDDDALAMAPPAVGGDANGMTTPDPEGEATTAPDAEATTAPEAEATTAPDAEASASGEPGGPVDSPTTGGAAEPSGTTASEGSEAPGSGACLQRFARCGAGKECCGGNTCTNSSWVGAGVKTCLPTPPSCYNEGERNEGADGETFVPYAPCCPSLVSKAIPSKGYGKFCVRSTEGSDTTAASMAEPVAPAGQNAPSDATAEATPSVDDTNAEATPGVADDSAEATPAVGANVVAPPSV